MTVVELLPESFSVWISESLQAFVHARGGGYLVHPVYVCVGVEVVQINTCKSINKSQPCTYSTNKTVQTLAWQTCKFEMNQESYQAIKIHIVFGLLYITRRLQ